MDPITQKYIEFVEAKLRLIAGRLLFINIDARPDTMLIERTDPGDLNRWNYLGFSNGAFRFQKALDADDRKAVIPSLLCLRDWHLWP